MSVPPLIDTLPELEDTVAPSLEQLVYGVGVLDLDAITTDIDDESKPVLDPESVSDSASPSETPSACSPRRSPVGGPVAALGGAVLEDVVVRAVGEVVVVLHRGDLGHRASALELRQVDVGDADVRDPALVARADDRREAVLDRDPIVHAV